MGCDNVNVAYLLIVLQAPIPGIVLSLRLGLTFRGWKPGHQELFDSEVDVADQQSDPPPTVVSASAVSGASEYGTILKLAG